MNQNLELIQLNDQLEVVKSQLGEPKKESDFLGYKVLWYGSRDPFVGDLLYFENDNLTVITSGISGKTLKDYIDLYGAPSQSIRYYKGDLQRSDMKDTTVHLWNDKGIDVVTYGNIPQSEVLMERKYLPTDMESYFSSVGRQFEGADKVMIDYAFTPQELKKVSDIEIESQTQISSGQVLYNFAKLNFTLIIAFIVIILTSIFVLLVLRKLRKQKKELKII